MTDSPISAPITKAATLITATVAAEQGIPDKAVMAVAAHTDLPEWSLIHSVSWDKVGQMVAAIYGLLLLGEWVWKRVLRPFAEDRGWIKRLKHRIISVEEYDAEPEPDKAPPP